MLPHTQAPRGTTPRNNELQLVRLDGKRHPDTMLVCQVEPVEDGWLGYTGKIWCRRLQQHQVVKLSPGARIWEVQR